MTEITVILAIVPSLIALLLVCMHEARLNRICWQYLEQQHKLNNRIRALEGKKPRYYGDDLHRGPRDFRDGAVS